MGLRKKILNEITLYCRDECGSNYCCPEDECILFRIERLVCEMDLERAKELIKIMIADYQEGCVSGESLTDDDVINYLFTLDFMEEELLELGFSEEAIDSANENNLSNGYPCFKITIGENISQQFIIEAEDMEAAKEKARKMYKACELVLENASLICVNMMAEDMQGNCTGWYEI